jgi:hypothetical protein
MGRIISVELISCKHFSGPAEVAGSQRNLIILEQMSRQEAGLAAVKYDDRPAETDPAGLTA